MADVDFEQHSEQNVHFFSRTVPALLGEALSGMPPSSTIVDVGCGDGHLVWALAETRRIPQGSSVFGVDLSPVRLRRFRELTGFEGIEANGQNIPALAAGSVDLAISTMVMEHVPDDQGYVHELARILRPGGSLYLSTVIRKRGAWYFRKAPDGRRVLDVTHLREYPSVEAVTRLIKAGGFEIKAQRLSRLVFPIAHPLVRLIHARRPIKDVQRLFLRGRTRWLEAVALPIPRYRSIEILARRVGG